MNTQGCQMSEAARQLSASENPLQRGNCVRLVSMNWVNDFTNLYNSTEKCVNRDYAIINKLGELYDYQTATEVKFLLDHVDERVRQEYLDKFLKTSNSDEQSIVKIRSPAMALEPEGSSVTLVVKWRGRTDINNPTSGRFRIYMRKDGMEKQVIFHRRAACILYLIHVLDIFESRKTAAIDKTNDGVQFCDLFFKVYCFGGQECFNNLIGNGTSKQKLLRHCMGDIRDAVGQTCTLLHEDASPYILSGKCPHIRVQKKDIVVDEKIFDPKYGRL